MFKSFVNAIKNTVNSISQYENQDKEEQPSENMNYGTYDLTDIYPYKIYTVQKNESIEELEKKLAVKREKLY